MLPRASSVRGLARARVERRARERRLRTHHRRRAPPRGRRDRGARARRVPSPHRRGSACSADEMKTPGSLARARARVRARARRPARARPERHDARVGRRWRAGRHGRLGRAREAVGVVRPRLAHLRRRRVRLALRRVQVRVRHARPAERGRHRRRARRLRGAVLRAHDPAREQRRRGASQGGPRARAGVEKRRLERRLLARRRRVGAVEPGGAGRVQRGAALHGRDPGVVPDAGLDRVHARARVAVRRPRGRGHVGGVFPGHRGGRAPGLRRRRTKSRRAPPPPPPA